MNFEDLKVIWNSQADAPMYAVNEEGLHALLRQNTAHFTRVTDVFSPLATRPGGSPAFMRRTAVRFLLRWSRFRHV